MNNSYKKTRRYRVAALLLAAATALALTGCGDKLPPNTVKTPEDARGKIIGALRDSACAYIAAEYGEVWQFNDMDAMLYSLRRGDIDCAVADASDKSARASRIKKLRDNLDEFEFSFAVAKENADLKKALDSAIESLISGGEMERIIKRVMSGEGYEPPPDEGARATLRMAVRTSFAPYSYVDVEGAWAGVDIAIARAVCGILGVDVEFTAFEPGELITAVRYGKADFAAGGLTAGGDESDLAEFSAPYATATLEILVRG